MGASKRLKQHADQPALKQLSLGLALLGLCLGCLAAYGVLSGDANGRVNLLFLLLLFAFLPVLGLLLSVILLLKGGGKGLAGWILEIPLWPRHLVLALSQLTSNRGRQLWLFYQTQVLAVSFSLGCLLLYLLLLLGSDITFVWRSTLLEPEDLLPVLTAIGLPWSFWPEAQASMSLIEQTRDFRLDAEGASPSAVGLWWKYILATQLTYSLLPRGVMLLVARRKYHALLQNGGPQSLSGFEPRANVGAGEDVALADVTRSVTAPYALLAWAELPSNHQAGVQQRLGDAAEMHHVGPLQEQAGLHLPAEQSLVVVVKSWEPPLAELADRLAEFDSSADKLLLPLDWNDTGLRKPSDAHLEEWRRFAATLPGWQVLQPEALA